MRKTFIKALSLVIPEEVINNNIVIWETESSIVCMAISGAGFGENLTILYYSKEFIESTRTD